MTTFDVREQAFEAKFAYDEDLAFRVTARRDKLVAHWLGTWLGLDTAAQTGLTASILGIPNTAPHDERLRSFVAKMAAESGRSVPGDDFVVRLKAFAIQAKSEVMAECDIKD